MRCRWRNSGPTLHACKYRGPFFEAGLDLELDVDFEVYVGVELDDLAVPEEVQLVFYIRKIEIKQSWVGATLFEIDFWSCVELFELDFQADVGVKLDGLALPGEVKLDFLYRKSSSKKSS